MIEQRKSNRRKARGYKIAVLCLTSFVTILLGLKGHLSSFWVISKEDVSDFALIISTTATAISAWETFANYRRLWVNNASKLFDLERLKSKIEQCETEEQSGDDNHNLNSFYQEYRDIQQKYHEEWLEVTHGSADDVARSNKKLKI